MNKAFESRVRLGIMSALVVNDTVDFKTLKHALDLTDGNLASHIAARENEGYVRVTKAFVGKSPSQHTSSRLPAERCSPSFFTRWKSCIQTNTLIPDYRLPFFYLFDTPPRFHQLNRVACTLHGIHRQCGSHPRLIRLSVPGSSKAHHALLLNPFYPKDPYASFGKHVLTPSLALTSIAASTPAGWTVRYWDENLLQGPPPSFPFPQVVGITVHLTFAERAFELARWYRRRGAKIVLVGLHVLSCPEECAPHADALAIGEGVQLWGTILRDIETGTLQQKYVGSYVKPYRDDPPPAGIWFTPGTS